MRYLSTAAFAIVVAAMVGCTSNRTPIAGSGGEGPEKASKEQGTTDAKEAPTERTGKARHGKKKGTFDAVNTFTLEIPEGAGEVKAWFAMPQKSDPDQTITEWKVECDHPTSVVKDQFGNEFLHLSLTNPAAGTITIKTSFRNTRHEVNMPTDPALSRAHTSEELKSLSRFLTEQNQGKVTDEIRKLAKEAVGNETNPIKMGRLLYDKVLDHVQYWVIDPDNLKSSGSGSATYTYEKCTGNCTDFHALYHAMCVAVNLPCRTVYGGFYKGPLDGVDRDASYHCWLEIHAPNVGWVPLDVSIADLYAQELELNDKNRELINLTLPDGYHGKDLKLVDYYYGNLDERRVVWHEGRDLELGQKDGPINFLPWYYAEVDGKKAGIGKRKFTYNTVK